MVYQKIQTVFMRDVDNIIIPTQFTKLEFEWLKHCKFRAEEKIDGTNIRVEINISDDGELTYEFKGRTDNAIIPTHLFEKLNSMFSVSSLKEVFDVSTPKHITLYGEGYGMKIQNGGNYIKDDVDFILFDIKVDQYWLSREAIEDIANRLYISIVPVVGYMTIPEAIQYVDKGFKSLIAENPNYDAEGLVLKTPDNLLMRNGERIVLKIKTVDFNKFRIKYGPLEYTVDHHANLLVTTKVEQQKNPHYEAS